MAEIICQNTYGMGTLNGVSDFINIEQPPYESTYMNISATWLKENTANNNHTMNSGISEGQSFDLRLNIYQSNSLIKYSDLLHSSTEMCYFSASNDNYRYGIQIVQNGSPASVKYGYAWSTDVMDYAPATNDGIYFLRSKDTNRYIFNDPAETNSHLKLKPKHVTIQNNFTDAHKWILKTTPTNYTLMTGYSTDAMYLGISNVSYGNAKYAALTNTAYELNILNNSDGTCTILSNDNTRMLSYSAGKMVWIPFTNLNDVPTVAKWFFDKVNFSQGDANADGEINIADLVYMQRAIDHIDTPTNIQAFLGDINRDGYYDSYDILALQNKLTP